MSPFDGSYDKYTDFRDIIEDFLIRCHPGWEQVLRQIEARTEPLTNAVIAATPMLGVDALEV